MPKSHFAAGKMISKQLKAEPLLDYIQYSKWNYITYDCFYSLATFHAYHCKKHLITSI